jgi:hypothetical protein
MFRKDCRIVIVPSHPATFAAERCVGFSAIDRHGRRSAYVIHSSLHAFDTHREFVGVPDIDLIAGPQTLHEGLHFWVLHVGCVAHAARAGEGNAGAIGRD